MALHYFLKLYTLAKAAGMNVLHVINILKIANNNLPEIEWGYRTLQREINTLKFKK
jgi:hypothetical protein